MSVTYGGDHISKSPFSVAVAPTLDLGKIKISGLEDSTCPGVGRFGVGGHWGDVGAPKGIGGAVGAPQGQIGGLRGTYGWGSLWPCSGGGSGSVPIPLPSSPRPN